MNVPVYVPGDWFAIVTAGSVAMLPPETPAGVVQELWAALRAGAPLTDQLQVLLGGGLASLPPFALVSVEPAGVRVVVRGDVDVSVATAAGPHVLLAPHVSTWLEESVADAVAVTVRAPGWDGAVDRALPVLSGVVRAAGVLVELRAGGTVAPVLVAPVAISEPAPVPEPAPVLEPVPVPEPEPEPAAYSEPEPESDVAVVPVADAVGQVAQVPEPELEDLDATVLPARPVEAPEDHDGMTVLSSDVVALRRQMPAWVGDAMPGPLAVPAPQTPAPARMILSSGLVVTLNRPVLLGRAPQVSRVANSEIPRLVTVASPNQDISRTHAEVRMDGEDVLVTDLHSTNGVILLLTGTGPRRLHPGEPAVVEPGVTVDLGEGVTFTVARGA